MDSGQDDPGVQDCYSTLWNQWDLVLISADPKMFWDSAQANTWIISGCCDGGSGAFPWRRFITIYTVTVEKPQHSLCWPTSVSFIVTLQKGGLDRPSKLKLREQKYSLSWRKREIILIYNGLHLTFPQYPPTSEFLYLEMYILNTVNSRPSSSWQFV